MFSLRWRALRAVPTFLLLVLPGTFIPSLRAEAQSQDPPRLVINHGGHTGVVRQVLYTQDGKNLISVGDDRAIRVWDAVKGVEIGPPIYGEVSDDDNDKLNCAALGPAQADGTHLLAVAGSTHDSPISLTDFKSNLFVIRLFTLKSSNSGHADASLTALLPGVSDSQTYGHAGTIKGLAFSPDGTRLASCSDDTTARVWNLATGKSVILGGRTLYDPEHHLAPHEHIKAVTGIAWSPQGDRIATCSADGTIRIWNPDAHDGTDLLGDSPHGKSTDAVKIQDGDEVDCIAWSGTMLVAGTRRADGGGVVLAWDANHLDKDPTVVGTEDKPITCIAVSPDGKTIAAGEDNTKPKDTCQVLLWSVIDSGKFQSLSAFQSHDAAVTAVSFAPNSDQVASADSVGTILLWRPQDRTGSQSLVGAGAPTEDISWAHDAASASDYILWTSGTRQYVYDFKHALCVDSADPDVPKDVSWNSSTQTAQAGGRTLSLEIASDRLSLIITGGDHPITINPDDPQARDTITAATFAPLPDGMGVVVGSLFHLSLYNAVKGNKIQDFSGHAAKITSVAVSAARDDGSRYLASTSNDQTVRIWKLGTADASVKPLLNVFASRDEKHPDDLRYVAWTEGGFYTCSANGQHIIGWQRNKGVAQEAEYDDAGNLTSLQSVGVVELVWKTGNIYDAVREAHVDGDVNNTDAPTVALQGLTDGQQCPTQKIEVAASIQPGQLPLQEVDFSVDGRPVHVSVSGKDPVTVKQMVTLRPGRTCKVSVTAYDTKGNHRNAETTVVCTAPAPLHKQPVLNLLAIGVRRYEKFLDLKYPDRDAKELAQVLKQQEGRDKLFRAVNTDVLVNQHATKQDILDHLKTLCDNNNQTADDDDYTIVFVAGHGGQTEDNRYWLLPFDLDSYSLQTVQNTAIDWSDIYDQLRYLRGHVILLIDTCHSAGATEGAEHGDVQAEQAKNDQDAASKSEGYHSFTNRLANDEEAGTNPLIVLTSCRPGQVSQEGVGHDSTPPITHGLFTEALLEALRPDNNPIALKYGTQDITLDDLVTYVKERVGDLNHGQRPQLLGELTNDANGLVIAKVDAVGAKTASR